MSALISDEDVLAALNIDDELLAHATDEELASLYDAIEELLDDGGAWELQDRQLVAERLSMSGEVFEVLYGGAVGGGKSEWLLWHMYQCCIRFPGFSALLLRRTFPELRRSLIMRSWARFDRSLGRYNVSEHTWYFHNGSVLEFGFCESDRDVFQYQSAEYDAIGFDELTQFETDFAWTYLASRCRTTVRKTLAGFPKPHMVAGTNPGNVGGIWVKKRFVDPCEPGEVFTEEIMFEDGTSQVVGRAFVPAKLGDNRFVNKALYNVALANLGTKLRLQLLDGSWDVVEGQFFEEWDRSVHVCAPFKIPDWWTRFTGYDYGYANPACHLWAALDPDGRIVVYREMYETRQLVRGQANLIHAAEKADPALGKMHREHITYRVADPSIWTHTGQGPPIASQFVDEGISFLKANNARIDGWMRLRSYLALEEGEGAQRAGIVIFSTCRNLIRTLPMLVHDAKRPEDLNTRQEDHAADALRYLVMSRPPRSVLRADVDPKDRTTNDKGERIVNIDKRMRDRKREDRSRVLGMMR